MLWNISGNKKNIFQFADLALNYHSVDLPNNL